MVKQLKRWLLGTPGRVLSEREAQNAVRVGRRLTMVREVYPKRAIQRHDRD